MAKKPTNGATHQHATNRPKRPRNTFAHAAHGARSVSSHGNSSSGTSGKYHQNGRRCAKLLAMRPVTLSTSGCQYAGPANHAAGSSHARVIAVPISNPAM